MNTVEELRKFNDLLVEIRDRLIKIEAQPAIPRLPLPLPQRRASAVDIDELVDGLDEHGLTKLAQAINKRATRG